MSSYNRPLTIFSNDGRLFQVEYATAAVKSSPTLIALKTDSAIVIGVEKPEMMKLQKQQVSSTGLAAAGGKVVMVDDHILCAFAGLPADARILIHKAQFECQSHKVQYEDPISVGNLTKKIASIMLKSTQYGGVRPFGVAMFICGFDSNKVPHIYESLPTGSFSEWKAWAMGQFGRPVQEYLEKSWSDGMSLIDTIKMAINAIRENCEISQFQNIEIAYLQCDDTELHILKDDDIEKYYKK